MSDSRIDINNLPSEMIHEIVARLPDSDKGRFGTTNHRHYELGFLNPYNDLTMLHGLFGDFKNPHLEAKSKQVYRLHRAILKGKKTKAEAMIKRDPLLLLETGPVVKDYAGQQFQGTALGLALGAEDVSVESKCHLLTVPAPANVETPLTTDYIINLNNIPQTASYVRCADKLFYADRINEQCIEMQLDQAALRQFDVEMKPQPNQLLSKEQLKKIISITDHDHEEEMAEMIMRYLRQLPDGEKEIARQISEQFPEGWEKQEEERAKRDSAALRKVITAIDKAVDVNACEADVQAFQAYLEKENKGSGVRKSGKHFNMQLLVEALNLYDQNYDRFGGWDSPKNNLCWRKIIGYVQRFLPACYAQAFCQGVYYLAENGEKLRRSLTFRFGVAAVLFPLDSDPALVLGSDYASLGGRRFGYSLPGRVASLAGTLLFTNYVKQKTSAVRRFTPQPDNHAESRCVVM